MRQKSEINPQQLCHRNVPQLHYKIKRVLLVLYVLYVYVCSMIMPGHTSGSQLVGVCQFFLSTTCVLENHHRSSSLVAKRLYLLSYIIGSLKDYFLKRKEEEEEEEKGQ